MTSQAELDFMHNFKHQTDGAKWAKQEIESLRQQLADREKHILLLKATLESAWEALQFSSHGAVKEIEKELAAINDSKLVKCPHCREVYEVWAGSEGVPKPENAVEAYLLQLVEQMRDAAKKGLR